jgi:nicotinic acid mononucleotide adenylyltransferase
MSYQKLLRSLCSSSTVIRFNGDPAAFFFACSKLAEVHQSPHHLTICYDSSTNIINTTNTTNTNIKNNTTTSTTSTTSTTFSTSTASSSQPHQSVARGLADISFQEACHKSTNAPNLESIFHHHCVGLGCVSSKEGNTHLVATTRKETLIWQLTKNAKTIEDKNKLTSKALFYSLARALIGNNQKIPEDLILNNGNEELLLQEDAVVHEDPLTMLLSGNTSSVIFSVEGEAYADVSLPHGCLIFPGSFNPLHLGHTNAARHGVTSLVASGKTVPGIVYEISAKHPDKGLLSRKEIMSRVEQFKGKAAVIVSTNALYVDKCEDNKGATFLIGADVCRKILDPKYTSNSYAQLFSGLERIHGNGCSFLVAGRKNETTDKFETLQNVLEKMLPNEADRNAVGALFQSMDGFRVDMSSTEIRKQNANI